MPKIIENKDRETLKYGFYPFMRIHAAKYGLRPVAHYSQWGEIYCHVVNNKGENVSDVRWRFEHTIPFFGDPRQIIIFDVKLNDRVDDITALAEEWENDGGSPVEINLSV